MDKNGKKCTASSVTVERLSFRKFNRWTKWRPSTLGDRDRCVARKRPIKHFHLTRKIKKYFLCKSKLMEKNKNSNVTFRVSELVGSSRDGCKRQVDGTQNHLGRRISSADFRINELVRRNHSPPYTECSNQPSAASLVILCGCILYMQSQCSDLSLTLGRPPLH
jgi:hypothetical protein